MMYAHTNITDTDVLRRALEIAHHSNATADEALAQAKEEAEEMDDALDPWRLRRAHSHPEPPPTRRRDVIDHDRWRARPSDHD